MRRIISVIKFQFERGYTYVGALGIGFVIATTLQDKIFSDFPLWMLYPLGVLGTWFVGYIDMKHGFYAAASEYQTRENPVFREMHEKSRRD